MEETKVCINCKAEKEIYLFIKNRNTCKLCLSAYNKKYREENKDKLALDRKKYIEEKKDKLALYNKKYREENNEKIALGKKKYREENKDKLALSEKKYREQNNALINAKAYFHRNRIPISIVPKELIEAKKLHLLLIAEIRNAKKHNHS